MILQSVLVESWKCFEGPAKFHFEPGLNIVHAPNGSGKSSLFEAIRSAFLVGHDTSRGEIRSVMPWGSTRLGPYVEIDFEDGDAEYNLKKKFLVDRKCEFSTRKNGKFFKDSEGKSADEAILRILDRALEPGKKEKWLLSKILLAHQGKIAIDSLSDDLQKNIRTVLSAQVGSAGPYEEFVQTRHSKYFTPTGKYTSGSKAPKELTLLTEDHEILEKELAEARADYENYESLSGRVSELRAGLAIAQRRLSDLNAQKVGLDEKRKKYSELLNKKSLLSEQSARERLVFSSLEQRIKDIEKLTGQIALTSAKIRAISEMIPTKKEEAAQADEKFRSLNQMALNLKKLEESLASQRTSIQHARDFVKISKDLQTTTEKKTLADFLSASINLMQAERAAFKAPEKKTIARVRKLESDVSEALKTLELSLIRLELTPEVDLSVEIIEDEGTRIEKIAPEAPVEFSGSPTVTARIPGVVKMKVSGPMVSVENQKLTIEKSNAELARIEGTFGTINTDDLEKILDEAVELDREINSRQAELEKVLDRTDMDAMIRKIQALEQERANMLFQYPDWELSMPEPDVMDRNNQEKVKVLMPKLRELEPALQQADRRLRSLYAELKRLPADLEQDELILKSHMEELAEKQADGKSVEQRLAERDKAAINWRALTVSLDEVTQELNALGDDPEKQWTSLQNSISMAQRQESLAREELAGKSAILENVAEKAPYARLTTLEERYRHLEKKLQRELIKRDAMALLKNTLDTRRSQALSGVAEPVELRATEIMRRIGDSKFSHVTLKQNFLPEGVRPDVMQADVSLENISGGEAEQLHLAVRIALAETLVKNDRHFMLLDDVLTATDSIRMERILGILQEMMQRFQVIVMTCHPERYRKLTTARFIDLARV